MNADVRRERVREDGPWFHRQGSKKPAARSVRIILLRALISGTYGVALVATQTYLAQHQMQASLCVQHVSKSSGLIDVRSA